MPLGKNIVANIKELKADNKRQGLERGANGKPRSNRQVLVIALHAADKAKGEYHVSRGTKGSIINKRLGGRFG